MEWHEPIGVIGVGIIIGMYLLLQLERLSPDTLMFSVLNGLGACFVLLSLSQDFNLSAFIIEIFWLLISLFGIVKVLIMRRPRRHGVAARSSHD